MPVRTLTARWGHGGATDRADRTTDTIRAPTHRTCGAVDNGDMASEVTIRPAVEDDLAAVARIYDHEVAHSHATFDLEPPPLDYWRHKLTAGEPGDHLLVAAEEQAGVVGYAYSWSYRPRPAYRRTRETSIYLDTSVRGRGIGRLLYPALLETMTASGVHTAVALVAQPNPASVALHASCGFEHVGTMREVGFKLGRWVDVEWYQKLLE
jgi:L-amino acid N-acyltransferase YncA